jgi:UDP-N-acetylglucosamine--N-acetylmuramyl-(pentapeptide) pyrophosphoryl-undecaprenol N-acetylglucosamine transferase
MEKFFPADRLVVSGNPIRPGIVKAAQLSKSEALRFFGLQEGRCTVLAVGGSLGARSINDALAAGLDELVRAGIQLIWQTGKTDAARWREAADGKPGVWVGDFITQMEQAYAAADIVLSRAGAMAVAELCVVAKPVVFVPYPHAAEDHQTANAQHLVQQNAALMVKDSEAGSRVIPELLALAGDGNAQQLLRTNIGKLGITDADRNIAQAILKQIA